MRSSQSATRSLTPSEPDDAPAPQHREPSRSHAQSDAPPEESFPDTENRVLDRTAESYFQEGLTGNVHSDTDLHQRVLPDPARC